jgi:uncharacterized membrane protein YidH (DUF202 family)
MGGLFKDIDRMMNWIFRISNSFLAWFFWIVYFFILMNTIFGDAKIGNDSDGISIFLILTSIWIWGTVRWLKRKGYIGKGKHVFYKNKKLIPFIITNIVCPVLVSLIVYSFTGSPNITIFSIPIFSFLSANIEIG